MTIAANQMKDAPAWATRFETLDDESGGWFERDLTKDVSIATAEGDLGGKAKLVLDGGKVYVSDEPTGQDWAEPGEMRKLAAHLLNAADAWSNLRRAAIINDIAANLARAMTAADVDVAGLAERTEIPVERIEEVLAGKVEVTAGELAMYAIALDVSASEIVPTSRDV